MIDRSPQLEGPKPRLTCSSRPLWGAGGRGLGASDTHRVFLHLSLSDSPSTRWSQEGASPLDARFAASPGRMSLEMPVTNPRPHGRPWVGRGEVGISRHLERTY